MSKLVFTMREALARFRKSWSTLDKEKIKDVIRLCLARELTCVEERKDAIDYRATRPKSFDFFDENMDLSAIKSTSFAASSPSRAGSPSPKKTNRVTVRDANTTGFEMRSLAESESRGAPRAFKDPSIENPPTLQLSTFKMAGKPTAENLRKLGSSAVGGGGVSERGGPKSARSGVSRTSRGEPVDPYKDHTVEQMDELI